VEISCKMNGPQSQVNGSVAFSNPHLSPGVVSRLRRKGLSRSVDMARVTDRYPNDGGGIVSAISGDRRGCRSLSGRGADRSADGDKPK